MMMETITMMMMSSGAVGVLFIYFVNLLGHFGTLIGYFEKPFKKLIRVWNLAHTHTPVCEIDSQQIFYFTNVDILPPKFKGNYLVGHSWNPIRLLDSVVKILRCYVWLSVWRMPTTDGRKQNRLSQSNQVELCLHSSSCVFSFVFNSLHR